jgi:hypothetical protein
MSGSVIVRRGATTESHGWCDGGCDWEAVDGRSGSYRVSQAARRHTEQTGHRTTFDRSYSVFIESKKAKS